MASSRVGFLLLTASMVGLGAFALAGRTPVGSSASPRGNAAESPLASTREPVRYGRDIRPILSDRCFLCHGPDRATQQAGLRLDSFEAATAAREDGAAIVPGKPDESLIWHRINSHDPDEVMPTPESNKKPLSVEERELVRRWIEQGAAYEDHWSFVAPAAHSAPAVRDAGMVRGDIDRFVQAKLESLGTSMSAEADAATLVRRLYLDLTGLPPTPEETDAYLADTREDRYERLVDRLLTEEPYATRTAERLSVPWLDLARYADTNGIHMDAGRQMWLWRDWVIEAFRANKPYDRFIVEQLAGDLLPGATVDNQIASGFNRAHVITDEGGAINEEYLLEYAVDRVNTTGTAFLGLSVGCARCHDHKFDPITAEDYYSLIAFFNSNEEPGLYSQAPDPYRAFEPAIEVPRGADKERLSLLAEAEQRARAEQASAGEADRAELDAFVGSLREGFSFAKSSVVRASSAAGATMTVQPDGSVLAAGENPDDDDHELVLRTDATGLRALMLEAMTDPSHAANRVGRAPNGNAVLDFIEVEAVSVADPSRREKVDLVWAWADYEQENGDYRAVNALTKDEGRQWAVRSHEVDGPRAAIFAAAKPFGFEGGTELVVRLHYKSPYAKHIFGRVRLTPAAASDAAIARLPEATSSWYIAGPVVGAPGAAYDAEYGPEKEATFVRGKRFTTADGAKIEWRHAPGVVDGQAVGLAASVGAEFVARQIYSPDARTIELSLGSDDGIAVYLNGRKVHENRTARAVAPDQERVSLALEPGQNFLVCKVVNTGGQAGFYARHLPREGALDRASVALVAPEGSMRAAAIEDARNAWRIRFSPSYIRASQEIARVEQERQRIISSTPKTMVMKELAMPRETFVHERGAYDHPNRSRPVKRAVPAVLGQLPEGAAQNRLGLAEWLVSKENPLTARVVVNRFWEMFFGNGIVRTSDDFGLQGEWPANPELLDTLAVRFRDGGWNMHALITEIVTSSAYRQASRVRPELAVADPMNRHLSHFPRQRLTAEQIRDQALYVAGILREQPGGPSVKPYQPEGLWQEVAMLQSNTRIYEQGMGDDLWRRSMYTYWKRAAPPPSLLTFDAPTREFCTPRRLTTNTPLQALVLWNDPQFVEAARVAAERVLRAEGNDATRMRELFRRATGEDPSESARTAMQAALDKSRARYKAAPEDAMKLVEIGEAPRAEGVDPAELAAWTMLANAVLSSDATIVKD
ncbi:MAG: PSD1 and planctomycete cytochrome C domain-containing protein [Planctomycetaceae bacterium]|nr:PSD1 and planctomycete cytochrome C domain-containing protein [Planctomycetaceae bacterium]